MISFYPGDALRRRSEYIRCLQTTDNLDQDDHADAEQLEALYESRPASLHALLHERRLAFTRPRPLSPAAPDSAQSPALAAAPLANYREFAVYARPSRLTGRPRPVAAAPDRPQRESQRSSSESAQRSEDSGSNVRRRSRLISTEHRKRKGMSMQVHGIHPALVIRPVLNSFASPSPLQEAAAAKIQAAYRAYRTRRMKLIYLASLSAHHADLRASFVFPFTLDFTAPSPARTSPPAGSAYSEHMPSPRLSCTMQSFPLLAHEDALRKVLRTLEGVDCDGDVQVMRQWRLLSETIGRELTALDERKSELWKEQEKRNIESGVDNERPNPVLEPIQSSFEVKSFTPAKEHAQPSGNTESESSKSHNVAQFISATTVLDHADHRWLPSVDANLDVNILPATHGSVNLCTTTPATSLGNSDEMVFNDTSVTPIADSESDTDNNDMLVSYDSNGVIATDSSELRRTSMAVPLALFVAHIYILPLIMKALVAHPLHS